MGVFEEAHTPEVQAAIDKLEHSIMEVLNLLYADDELDGAMPQAWALGVEFIGYTRIEGKKTRDFEVMMPEGQSLSATRGVLSNADDQLVSAYWNADDEE